MLCAIYKSKKKPGSYLYLAKRDDFSSLPEALLEQFGKPEIVMMFNLLGSKRLHSVDNQEILEKIIICLFSKLKNKSLRYLNFFLQKFF